MSSISLWPSSLWMYSPCSSSSWSVVNRSSTPAAKQDACSFVAPSTEDLVVDLRPGDREAQRVVVAAVAAGRVRVLARVAGVEPEAVVGGLDAGVALVARGDPLVECVVHLVDVVAGVALVGDVEAGAAVVVPVEDVVVAAPAVGGGEGVLRVDAPGQHQVPGEGAERAVVELVDAVGRRELDLLRLRGVGAVDLRDRAAPRCSSGDGAGPCRRPCCRRRRPGCSRAGRRRRTARRTATGAPGAPSRRASRPPRRPCPARPRRRHDRRRSGCRRTCPRCGRHRLRRSPGARRPPRLRGRRAGSGRRAGPAARGSARGRA